MATHSISTICPYCGVGCGINLLVDGNTAVGVEPQPCHPISRGQLCAKGWSTAYGIDIGDRISKPLLRDQHGFHETSWDNALNIITEKLTTIIAESGADALGVISSARATNEDNYAAQKLARAVFKTNNVDHCARICHSPTVAGLKMTLGSGAMTNSAEDIFSADVIMVIGADPTENHSIIGGHIMRAQLQGAKLIVIDPRKSRLAKLANIHLQLKAGSNIALINAMLEEIISHQWHDQDFIQHRCEGFDELAAAVSGSLVTAPIATGVDSALICAAAKAYSQANNAMILYGMGVTQYVSGTFNVISLSNLALTCGQIGRPGTGINPLRGQNNVQGACDMGCLPNVYPGYQAVDDSDTHHKFSAAWGTELSNKKGLTSLGMTTAAMEGSFHGLILFGEDPVVTDPDQNHVRAALQKLDLLVVAELTMTETAKLADVVLPAASFAEKDGTFTNCERRVQHLQQALSPTGETRADWRWLAAIAERLGSDQLNWDSTEEIFNEMAALTPIYSGMSYHQLDQKHGLQWPCNEQHPLGTAILHRDKFATSSGKAQLIGVHPIATDETADDQYPLILTTNRLHFHYGCGSMTRKSPLLERETPAGILFINPQDAKQKNIHHLDPVGVRSRRGYLETRAMYTEDVPPGLVSMPYHFREAPSNQLTNAAQDPISKMPELKACAVAVTALEPGCLPRDMDTLRGVQ
jgi:formate dehydrogenase major subunit